MASSLSGGEQSNLLHEGFKRDLLDKVLSAQEKHGAFFGAHTLSILILFFPMSLFLFPSILKNIYHYPRLDQPLSPDVLIHLMQYFVRYDLSYKL